MASSGSNLKLATSRIFDMSSSVAGSSSLLATAGAAGGGVETASISSFAIAGADFSTTALAGGVAAIDSAGFVSATVADTVGVVGAAGDAVVSLVPAFGACFLRRLFFFFASRTTKFRRYD